MSFPSTLPTLDTFVRANANPLNGLWTEATAFWGLPLRLVSNQVAASPAPDYYGGSVYTRTPFANPWQFAMALPVLPPNDGVGVGNANNVSFGLWLQNPVTEGSPDGYELDLYAFDGQYSAHLYFVQAGAYTPMLLVNGVDVQAGDLLGASYVGNALALYRVRAGVAIALATSNAADPIFPAQWQGAFYLTPGISDGKGATPGVTRVGAISGMTVSATVAPTISGISQGRRTGTGLSPLTISHTVTAGTTALLIYAFFEEFGESLPNVTYGGQVVPVLNHHLINPYPPSSYRLLDPPVGTADLVITPAPTAVLPKSLAAFAINVLNYGGIRFADWAQSNIDILDPPLYSPAASIYNSATDLVLSFVSTDKSSATFTPDASQALLVAQNGFADTSIKLAVAQAQPGFLTATDWTLTPDERRFVSYITAIKGLDGIPSAVHVSIGPVTNSFTTEDQPSLGNVGGSLGENWRWLHTVPFTHRFLTVLVAFHDGFLPVTAVTFGGVPLTKVYTSTLSQQWVLAEAPIGTAEIVVTTGSASRTFCAGAYSLSTSGLIATVSGQTLTYELTVASQPGALVIGLIDFYKLQNVVYLPDPGQTLLWEQPFLFNSVAPRPLINTSGDAGASAYGVATASTFTLGWTIDPPTDFDNSIAFSFIPVPPPVPPPEGPQGCPNSLEVLPVSGIGCAEGLQSPAV